METPASIARESRNATPFSTLRRFAVARQQPAKREFCELCRVGLAPEHRHLLETATHQMICACDPCALRFENVRDGRFKLIPRDVRSLPDFHLTDAQWEDLALPIDLAFLVYSTPTQKMMALYPSPAGATESLLSLPAWDLLVADNPALARLEPDVEALLVNRVGERRLYFLAPIDVCFELVGLMRTHWRGLSGGEEVWREIEAFFARLEERARPVSPQEVRHA
ncbi:MAG: DUF5947 family protein [Methylacidiphilales bacterium]|nr:DUF5947 family protein [Candidatus Methylacidiphilales bacterium]